MSQNQGRRPLYNLPVFIMKKMSLFCYYKQLVMKLQKLYQCLLEEFYYFDVNIYRITEIIWSLLIVIPTQLFSITYRFMLKPCHYYILRTSVDDPRYTGLRSLLYKFVNNLHMTIAFPYLSFSALALYFVNNTIPYRGFVDKTNNLMDDHSMRPYEDEYKDSHIIYTLDGIGTQFMDIFLIQNFIVNVNIVIMHYFGFFNNIKVRYFRTRPIIDSIINEYNENSPFKVHMNIIERFTTWFLRPVFIDYGAMNNADYRKDLVDTFAYRVRSENPKSLSLVGLNHGGYNLIVLLHELHRRSCEFEDIIRLIKSAFLVGAPVSLPSDYNLMFERDYPIYQIFGTDDDIANKPVTSTNGGLKIADLNVIPIKTNNIIPDPHLSSFITPDLPEYIAHLTVWNAKWLIDELKEEPAYSLDVFVKKGVLEENISKNIACT